MRWPSGRCACLRAGPAPARAHGRRWAGVLLVCAHGRRPARRRTWGLPAAARSPALVAHWLQAVLNRRPGSRAALRPPSFPRASPAHRLKGARRPPSARGSADDRLLYRHQAPFEALSTMVSSWRCSKYSRSLRGHAYPGRFGSRKSSTQSVRDLCMAPLMRSHSGRGPGGTVKLAVGLRHARRRSRCRALRTACIR